MARHIKKTEHKLSKFIANSISNLFYKVLDMEKKGISEVSEQGELSGETKDGHNLKVKYGYGIKVGLDDFVKELKEKN